MYEQNQNVQDTMLIGKDKKYLIMKDIMIIHIIFIG